MPTAPMVPALHPMSPVPPGLLPTPSPLPPTCLLAPAAAPKPKLTQSTTPRPKPMPAERQGGPKPPQGKPGPSAGKGVGGTSVEKQKAQVLPQGKGTSQLTSYTAAAVAPRLPARASLIISLSHSTASIHLCAQASMAPASLVSVYNDALVKTPCHANVQISATRWTPKGNFVFFFFFFFSKIEFYSP